MCNQYVTIIIYINGNANDDGIDDKYYLNHIFQHKSNIEIDVKKTNRFIRESVCSQFTCEMVFVWEAIPFDEFYSIFK